MDNEEVGLDLLTLQEVAKLFRTTAVSIKNKVFRGTLGPDDGLRYFGSKPYFLKDILIERMRQGKLGKACQRRHIKEQRVGTIAS